MVQMAPHKKMAGWKAPGPDGLEAFWWRTFKGPARVLKEMMWEIADGKTETPQWLVEGRTVMIPKGANLTSSGKGEPLTKHDTRYTM